MAGGRSVRPVLFGELLTGAAQSNFAPLGPDAAGYYSTAPLRATLEDLVDFNLLNRNKVRLHINVEVDLSRDTPEQISPVNVTSTD